MKFRTILNPAAGKGKAAENGARVRKILRNRGAGGDIVETSEAGDAYYLGLEVARRGFDRVVAVGGDGTVREVARGKNGRRFLERGSYQGGKQKRAFGPAATRLPEEHTRHPKFRVFRG